MGRGAISGFGEADIPVRILVLTDQESSPRILHLYLGPFTVTSPWGTLAGSAESREEGLTSNSAFKVTGKRTLHPGGTH